MQNADRENFKLQRISGLLKEINRPKSNSALRCDSAINRAAMHPESLCSESIALATFNGNAVNYKDNLMASL